MTIEEVFYDCYCPEIEKWTFAGNLNKKKISFYRISAEYFISTSEQIGILNLTEEEYTLIKPNFPLRFCRIKDFEFDKINNYLKNPDSLNIENDFEMIFQNKIVLLPRTKNDKIMKGEIVELKSIQELLIKTNELQKSIKNLKFNGIGCYRHGIENKLPSFYIGEYK